MKSQVEVNQKLIAVNDILLYVDSSNAQKWIVTELFEGGFSALSYDEEKDFYFTELQTGWSISEKTIERRKQAAYENNEDYTLL